MSRRIMRSPNLHGDAFFLPKKLSLKSGQKSPSSSMTGQKLDPSSPHSPSSRNSTTNDAQGKEKPKPVRRSLFGVESTIATPNLKMKDIEPIKSVQKLDPQALTNVFPKLPQGKSYR